MTHSLEACEKQIITETLFLLRTSFFFWEGVNYLSWTLAYYVAIHKFFDKYSLRTKGLFHLSQKSGTKV